MADTFGNTHPHLTFAGSVLVPQDGYSLNRAKRLEHLLNVILRACLWQHAYKEFTQLFWTREEGEHQGQVGTGMWADWLDILILCMCACTWSSVWSCRLDLHWSSHLHKAKHVHTFITQLKHTRMYVRMYILNTEHSYRITHTLNTWQTYVKLATRM